MNKIDKKNTIWNIIGSGLNAFSSLIFLIIVTRINGTNESGIFSFCFATACLFYSIAVYLGRTYQVTENGEYFSDSDYIYNRMITIAIMLISIFFFSFLNHYDISKILLLELLAIYKCVEAFSESLYAVIQKNNQLYLVGISMALKSFGSYLLFLIIDILIKDIYISTIVVIFYNLIITFFLDFKKGKKVGLEFKQFSREKNRKLLKNGFFTFAFSFLSLYVLNSSRYAIDTHLNDYSQMIFGIIVMPAMVMSLLSQFIIHPILVKIKLFIKEQQYKELNKTANQLILFLFGLGILLIIGCYILGIPILQLLYSINLKDYKTSFMLIIIGSIFYGGTIIISYILIGMRKTLSQFVLLIISSFFATISSNIFVLKKGLFGAGINFLLVMVLEFIFYFLLLKKNIRKESIKK